MMQFKKEHFKLMHMPLCQHFTRIKINQILNFNMSLLEIKVIKRGTNGKDFSQGLDLSITYISEDKALFKIINSKFYL